MAIEIDFEEGVENDLDCAYGWYEQRRFGLGEEFLQSVEASFEAIRRAPTRRAIFYKNYRRCLVRKFPYAVFYEFVDERVTVYAVLHTARNPRKWRERLP